MLFILTQFLRILLFKSRIPAFWMSCDVQWVSDKEEKSVTREGGGKKAPKNGPCHVTGFCNGPLWLDYFAVQILLWVSLINQCDRSSAPTDKNNAQNKSLNKSLCRSKAMNKVITFNRLGDHFAVQLVCHPPQRLSNIKSTSQKLVLSKFSQRKIDITCHRTD